MNHHAQSELKIWQPFRVSDCVQCDLHKGAKTVCLLGDGPVPSEGMVIGEAPGYTEDETEIPFSGQAGLYLRRTLKDIGVDPRSLYITNAIGCRPPANRTISRSEVKTCAPLYLMNQIAQVKPKVILLLGNTAISAITGKKATVTSMEGVTFDYQGITCVPGRHPSSVIRAEGEREFPYLEQKFRENLLLFRNTLTPKKDDFTFTSQMGAVQLAPSPRYVYTDLESNSLNPFRKDSKIWCIGFAQNSKEVSVTPTEFLDKKSVKETLKRYPIIAHRATFEGIWYRTHYGITPRIYHDTKLCAYLQNENEPSGLKYQAVQHLKNPAVEPWSEDMDFQDPDFDKLLPYCARDNSYGMRLYLERDLPFLRANPKVARLMRYILLPAIEVFIEIICNGFHADPEEIKKKLKIVQKKKREINLKLNKLAGKEMNVGSPKQVSHLFYSTLGLECPVKTPKGKDSTSEAALIRLRGQHEATDLVWDWRGWDKQESTYLEPWLRNGPILHASYDFTGTDTGRLSSSMVKTKRHEKGNGAVIHQCPRDGFIRNLVTPRNPGWRIVAGDLSQVELRLVAHAANEPTMLAVFQNDPNTPEGDIHYQTARTLQAIGEIVKETRKKAKAVNFGFVYGMWAKKFVAYALEKFDLKLSNREGNIYRNKFFNKYSGLLPWHRRVEAFVSQNGFIDSILGRRRHLPTAKIEAYNEECFDCRGNNPKSNCFGCGGTGFIQHGGDDTQDWVRREAVRQAINSPIQHDANAFDLLIAALIASYSLPWDFKIDRKRCLPFGAAHDSLLFEAHPDYAAELKRGILWTVSQLPAVLKKFFDLEMRCPILMDVNVYKNCWEGETIDV